MRRHSFSILMALVTAGLGLAVAAPVASALTRPTVTSITKNVGQTTNVKLGKGAPYSVNTCTSAQPTIVACQVLTPPAQKVQVWCLEPTMPAGTVLTITYLPVGAAAPIPSTSLTVHCLAISIPTVRVLGPGRTTIPLKGVTAVTGCTTNVLGAFCSFTPGAPTITELCQLAVTGNVLPVQVDATVTVAGAPAINGQNTDIFFRCGAPSAH